MRHAIGRPDDADRREMWFVLGQDSLGIDAENLVISFDANGRVTKAEQVQT